MSTSPVDVDAVLHALAEPRRAQIVRLLAANQLATRDLVKRTGMTQPLVSHHLRVLREARLVETTTCERLTVYRLQARSLAELALRLGALAERAAQTSATPPC